MIVFPTVNASLNFIGACLLIAGLVQIKRGNEEAHKRCMFGALGASVLFLTSYVIYHSTHDSRPFWGEGTIRTVYLTVLLTHIVLAAIVPFLALRTAWLGIKDRRAAHRRWARWTFPIWLYVSVTGVVIYVMLYLMGP